jgi:hypothetical protein
MRYLLALACVAFAAPASSHGWYSELRSPQGERCCNDRDCRAVDHRYNLQSGQLEIEILQQWVPIDPAKVLPLPSPDGKAHACFAYNWFDGKPLPPTMRCIILPGSS